MAGRGPAGARRDRWRVRSVPVALLVAVALATGCTPTEDSRPPRPGGTEDAALTVSTVGDSRPADDTRARLESEVSDVLAAYVVGSFLGDHPRTDYVDAFADFTPHAAQFAVRDIDALTVAGFPDATAVRARRLDCRLSFFIVGRQALGATAWVDFAFEVSDGGVTTTATLTGRFSLQHVDGDWRVFGYRLLRGGTGEPVTAESS